MYRYELYICTNNICDNKPLYFNNIITLLDFIHGLLKFNKKVNKIIIKKTPITPN